MLSTRQTRPSPSLDRAILRLALPAAGGYLLKGLLTLTDAFWSGRLGSEGLAAFATSSFFAWGITSLSLIASVGTAARVARATGAGDGEAAAEAARDGLWAALSVSSVVGLLIWLLAPALVGLQEVPPEVAASGIAYLRSLAFVAPAYFVHDAADAALRGSGDTRTPAYAVAVAVAANFVLDPLFMLRLGLGVAGAGYGTALLHAATAAGLWWVVRRRGGLAGGRPSPAALASTLRIGLPSATLGVGFAAIYVAITPIVSRFGTPHLAAMAIGHRSESIIYLVSVGYASAAQALVGQRLGASDPEGARRAAERATWHAALFAGAVALALFAFAPTFARAFTSDAATVAAAILYLRIVCLSTAVQTVEQVLTGAFEGAGDTLPPLWVGVITHGLRWPLAVIAVSLGLGIGAVWGVIAALSVAAGVLLALIYRRARWRWAAGKAVGKIAGQSAATG